MAAESHTVEGRQFRTKADYEAALRDKEKIDAIKSKFDLNNPADVLALYEQMRAGNTGLSQWSVMILMTGYMNWQRSIRIRAVTERGRAERVIRKSQAKRHRRRFKAKVERFR